MNQNQQQNQPQMTVQDAASTLHEAIQEKMTACGRELDATRAALNFLVNSIVGLDRALVAVKAAAEKAGVDVEQVIQTALAPRQAQRPAPVAAATEAPLDRAAKRRLKAVKAQQA